MTTEPEPDERRIRSFLIRRGVGPDADPDAWWDDLYPDDDQEPGEQQPAPRAAIVPTKVIPAGAPLPPRPPDDDEVPPWRPEKRPMPPTAAPPTPPAWTPPPAPAAPPPPYGPIEVRVTFPPMVLPPAPTRWERLAAWAARFGRPWQVLTALAAAVIPIPFTGYSAATTWHYVVSEARDSFGAGQGYALGAIPFAFVVFRLVRKGGTVLRLFSTVVCSFGLAGAVSWFDPITIITGVQK